MAFDSHGWESSRKKKFAVILGSKSNSGWTQNATRAPATHIKMAFLKAFSCKHANKGDDRDNNRPCKIHSNIFGMERKQMGTTMGLVSHTALRKIAKHSGGDASVSHGRVIRGSVNWGRGLGSARNAGEEGQGVDLGNGMWIKNF